MYLRENDLSFAKQLVEGLKLEKKVTIQDNVIEELKDNLRKKESLKNIETKEEMKNLLKDIEQLENNVKEKEELLESTKKKMY